MELEDYRKEIDSIDKEIVKKFQERMKVAGKIAEFKKDNDLSVKDEAREKEKIQSICDMADDNMETYCKMLYNNILEMSRDYQRRIMQRGENLAASLEKAYENTPKELPRDAKIACHGGQEPYCRQACQTLFGTDSGIVYYEDLVSIFEAVTNGDCRYAVITVGKQIETSNRVYEMLEDKKCYIVKSVMTGKGIRFICISKDLEIYEEANRTCLMLELPDIPGALYGVLDKFYALGLNVSRLKSWTVPDNEADLKFCFDVEIEFGSDEFINMVEQVDNAEQDYTYLGSYTEI